MGHQKDTSHPVKVSSETDNLMIIFRTLGDTTVRMFVPVLLGAGAGLLFDGAYETKYGAIVGSLAGLVLAGALVWRQYKEVTKK